MRGDEMAKAILNFVVLAVAIVSLFAGEQSFGELRIIIPNGYDIELSEQEKAELTEIPRTLIRNVSELLLASIENGEGEVWLIDQRDEPREQYPLMAMIGYPEVTVNAYRKYQPRVTCEGSYDPVVWDYCRDSSDSFLKMPGHNQIHINHESITYERVVDMYAFLDSAELESPIGERISSQYVHNLLYRSKTDLYYLIGDTPNHQRFTIYLRPTDSLYGAKYEISDWSCQ